MEETTQETIREKTLEAPFFWAFVIWLIPPAGIIFGAMFLLTKKLTQNRNYGYKALITGIIGSIAPLFVYAAMSSYFKDVPRDRNFGVISQMITVYLIVYGVLVGSLCGGISGYSESRVRTTEKHLKKYKNKEESLSKNICPNPECAFENETNSKFCEQCGAKLKE